MKRTFSALVAWCLAVCLPLSPLLAQSWSSSSEIQGFLEPYQSVDVAAAEMGIVAEVLVREGQEVQAGQILARLDNRGLEALLVVAQQRAAAVGALQSAQLEVDRLTSEWNKLKELQARNHASQVEIDRAQFDLQTARAALQTARENQQVHVLEAQQIQAQIEMRTIRSPLQGVVVEISKDPGEFVSASDPVVLNIVQLDKLKAVFLVPEAQASRLPRDAVLSLEIGTQRRRAEGRLEFISPVIDAQSGTRRISISIPNGDRRWECGDVCYLPTSTWRSPPAANRLSAAVEGVAGRKAEDWN